MRKAGILAVAFITALLMIAPSLSVNTDAEDSWDTLSSAYSLSAEDTGTIYTQLTDDYDGRHFCISVFNKTGFNFLENENNEAMGIISNISNVTFSDGIIKSIDNKYETVVVQYKEVICDFNVTVTIYDGTKTGSLTNDLYTSEDRGFSELLSYLGLADSKTFTTGDEYYLPTCHAKSYVISKTTTSYEENLAGDYFVTGTFTETTEVLELTGATLYYKSSTTGMTKSADCSISLTGEKTTTVNHDYGSIKYPVTGTEYTAKESISNDNNGYANYVFSDSTHTAWMTNPQSVRTYAGTCATQSYSEITSNIAKSGPGDIYPCTNPDNLIKSLTKNKVVHTTVSEVEGDIDNLDHKYGLAKDEKDMSFLKQVAYVAAIIVFIVAVVLVYMFVIRKKSL